jgi:hypothetical protein
MRIVILIILLGVSHLVKSQVDDAAIVNFNNIKSIPHRYYSTHGIILSPGFTDSSFNYFIDKDTLAIPFLIKLLSDASVSNADNPKKDSLFKKSELAVILINFIEPIPFF